MQRAFMVNYYATCFILSLSELELWLYFGGGFLSSAVHMEVELHHVIFGVRTSVKKTASLLSIIILCL